MTGAGAEGRRALPSARTRKVQMNQRTEDILAFIKQHTRERGFPPTIREIGEHFGISSTNGVRYHLSILEKAGRLTRKDRLSRGLYAVETDAEVHGIPIIGDVAAVAGGAGPERGLGNWLLVGVGLVSTLLVTVIVTRIARRALAEATGEDELA